MDWKTPPYSHAGRWEKNIDSIMSPGEKITWPQFIAEMVIFWRSKIIKDFPKISVGPGWSNAIQKQVRSLNQQASAICNYFPHPNDEPLVVYAVKKYFRQNRPLKIGQFRKTRITKKSGRESLNITQDEKDIVLGINAELVKALQTRQLYVDSSVKATPVKKEDLSFNTQRSSNKRSGSLAFAMELEKQLKNRNNTSDNKNTKEQ